MIPPITDPLGVYWDQPDTKDILVDETHAIMTERTLEQLAEYSASIPTGTYDGKMWRARGQSRWFLRWYGPHPDPTQISIHTREILLV